MSIIQIMVTIIIVTILVTVILGVASYGAYWMRRGRRPAEPVEVDTAPRFFYRYTPNGEDEPPGDGNDGGSQARQPEGALSRPAREVAGVGSLTDAGNGGTAG